MEAGSVEQANFSHLVWDIAWFGLALPATSRFMSIYAIRLGATPLELGLLSALPAIIAMITSAWSTWWRRKYSTPDTTHAVYLPGLGFRFIFALPMLAPFLPPEWQVPWLILSVSLPALGQGMSSVLFLVLMREAVRPDRLRALISRRQLALNAALAFGVVVFGFWLEHAPFPVNYQIMFILGFAFTLVSLYYVLRVRSLYPSTISSVRQPSARPWRSPAFRRVIFIASLTHIAFTAAVPIIPLRLVNELGAGEGFMSLYGLAELLAAAAVALVTNRLAARIGNLRLISLAMLGTVLAVAWIALSPNLELTVIGAALTGASWTAAGVGIFSFFSEMTPAEDMTRYTTAYNQTISLAIFVGPMIGSGLANGGVSLAVVLLLSAAIRLLVSLLSREQLLERWWKLPAPEAAAEEAVSVDSAVSTEVVN